MPILIFGPLTGAELARAVAAGADVVAWSAPFVAQARKLAARIHVKLDSGMGRLGVDAATAHGVGGRRWDQPCRLSAS